MTRFSRWYMLYMSAAFVVLIPVASYYVVTHGLPKKPLLFAIPVYMLLAFSCYKAFKRSK